MGKENICEAKLAIHFIRVLSGIKYICNIYKFSENPVDNFIVTYYQTTMP